MQLVLVAVTMSAGDLDRIKDSAGKD